MNKKRIRRHFSKTYDEVTTKAQAVQPQFSNDQPAFVSFDPVFTPEFGTELKNETDQALADDSEEKQQSEIELRTNKLKVLRLQAANAYKRLLYFVHSAFGETKAVDSAFGRPRYSKARRSEKEMIPMLNQAVTAARSGQFNAGLTAKGMSEDLLTELEDLANQLIETDNEQEMLKKQQLIVTDERIKLYNSIWDKLVKINSAAKILFPDDPARLAIYQLYETSTETAENETPPGNENTNE
ncbi:hypothetical protein [Prolixibacter sp. NT017]|uniref:hypothetical protein n=1 Tax=Prolixibacter sp. NT017 TaxID=2652390 RepID=UPI00127BBD1A|nr:hypothetical protein [Prolixibacter sp. NT017]GET27021.1 hypothetical protein NT017_33500 [Prolixibacter sp. NT017]